MKAARVLKALGPIDALSAVRDPMLRWMLAMPVLLGLAVRWGLPPVGRWLELRFQVSIAEYYPLLGSFLSVTAPTIYGAVIGFLLLEQRDDGTLTALQVTPLTARGYAVWRIAGPMLGSVVGGLVALRLAGIPGPGFPGQLLAAVAAAPLAPAWALFLPAFAANKVQGFALSKALGVVFVFVVVGYLLDSPWQYAAGLVPQFWPAKLYWLLVEGAEGASGGLTNGGWIQGARGAGPGTARGAAPVLVAGLAYQLALLWLLLRRYERVAHR